MKLIITQNILNSIEILWRKGYKTDEIKQELGIKSSETITKAKRSRFNLATYQNEANPNCKTMYDAINYLLEKRGYNSFTQFVQENPYEEIVKLKMFARKTLNYWKDK